MDDLVTSGLADMPAANETGTDRLRELHRLTELGRLSAHLLHEIANPLTAAMLHLENDSQPGGIQHARRSILTLQRYVDSMRQQVRQESNPTLFYTRPQLSDIRRVLRPVVRRAGVRLHILHVPNYRLYGDPVKFQQVISNLVTNAVDAYAGLPADSYDKVVRITFSRRSDWLAIKVRDYGSGIKAHDKARVFEPFFSTKSGTGGGLGIGLAMVKQYVETDFGGTITFTSPASGGTCFQVKFPVRRPAAYSDHGIHST